MAASPRAGGGAAALLPSRIADLGREPAGDSCGVREWLMSEANGALRARPPERLAAWLASSPLPDPVHHYRVVTDASGRLVERFLVVELFGRYCGETCLLSSYLAGTDRARHESGRRHSPVCRRRSPVLRGACFLDSCERLPGRDRG